jgi:polygalacturonase
MKRIKYLKASFLASLFAVSAAFAQTKTIYYVTNYGAKGDGKTMDTKSINAAITAAADAGGGTVFFPAGNYLSGSIHLKSNISLYIDQGATIVAADYTPEAGYDDPETVVTNRYEDFGHRHWHNSLIWGENIHDVSILGQGMIWGKGLERTNTIDKMNDETNKKPNKSIALLNCRNINIKDISILHGGWCGLLATGADNLTVNNVKMDTNRDGMDIDCCQNVHISDCSINSPMDDGICLKSSYSLNKNRATENVTITNCQVSGFEEGSFLDGTYKRVAKDESGPTGRIKFGTESNGGFKNITISNCTFVYCRGLALETVDGALLEDVTISNITMREIVNAPIFVRLGARMRGPETDKPGTCQRVIISNVVAYDVDAKQAAIISGVPGHDINDLTLNNIRIYFKGGGTAAQARNVVPSLEKEYPEPNRFGITPTYGFFIRNVTDLKMKDVEVHYQSPDQRPPFMLDAVNGADIEHIRAQKAAGVPGMVLSNVKGFSLKDCSNMPDTKLPVIIKKNIL